MPRLNPTARTCGLRLNFSRQSAQLGSAVRRFDPSGRTNQSITPQNLQGRADALDSEFVALYRSWNVWRVRHGMVRPEETQEVLPNSFYFEHYAR